MKHTYFVTGIDRGFCLCRLSYIQAWNTF